MFLTATSEFVIAPLFLELLLGNEASLHQLLPSLKVGFGEFERALPRCDFCFRGR